MSTIITTGNKNSLLNMLDKEIVTVINMFSKLHALAMYDCLLHHIQLEMFT